MLRIPKKSRESIMGEKRPDAQMEKSPSPVLQHAKVLLGQVFLPPLLVVILCFPLIVVLMVWVFALGNQDSLLSYVAYVVCAWALVVLVVAFVRKKPWKHAAGAVSSIMPSPLANKSDRIALGVRISFCIDLAWAVTNLWFGISTASSWFGALGAYYLFLACIRGAVLISMLCSGEPRKVNVSKVCGIMIALSSPVIAVISALVVLDKGGFVHHELVVYVMALYAFYALIMGIWNYVKHHADSDPIICCALNASLVNALVTMFALEVAMLAAFGSIDDATFKFVVCAITGAVIAVAVFVIGVRLFRRGKEANAKGRRSH